MKALWLLPLLFPLAGCVTTGQGSVKGGECKVFEAPPFAVRGARSYDQDWIDSTIEGGVGACKWHRPAARPPELDAPPVIAPHPVARPVPVKRYSVWKRVKAKVWPVKVAPVLETPLPVPAPVPAPAPVPPPAPAPRSAIDELLDPK